MTKLTKEQIHEVKSEMVKIGVPVRFISNGQCINIETGELSQKNTNIINQTVYWNFTRETSIKVAKYLKSKYVFSE